MKALAWLVLAAAAWAQAPKPLPPAGIEIPAADRVELQAGLDRLHGAIASLHGNPLVPDVLIYEKAVRYALEYREFFKPDEIAKAKALLEQGQERAAELAAGRAPWTTATGLIVRGYISKIDHSVQPYGVVVPPSYSPDAPHRWRLDTWFHGRGETLSEVNFLTDRERNRGEFTPRDTIVLHLYGRFCNASKFAGEVDLFEALDAVKQHYPIDENRILVRGFSMGGASAWHIGTHFAGLWAAVAPGAGFAESEQYLKLKLTGDSAPPWWEQKLFHLYDVTDYAANLYNTSSGGVPRRDRSAAAGGRHDAARHGGGRPAPHPHRRPADGAPVPPRCQDRNQPDRRRAGGARARSVSAQSPFHDVDPGVQPHEVGDARFAGTALGAGAPQRGDHGGFGGARGAGQRDRIHARDGSGRMPAGSGGEAGGDDRRPEGNGARADVRPLVDRSLSRVRRKMGRGGIGRSARSA